MNYKLDLVKSPIDKRDWKYENHLLTSTVLPESLDLRSKLGSVRNQGSEGACAAFAASTMKEYQEKIDCDYTGYLSPWFVYLNRENQNIPGMYLRDVMKILKNYGICPESKCSYEGIKNKSEITPDVFNSAKTYVISNYAQINSIDELKHALVEKGPCLIAFPVYNQGTSFWKKNNQNDPVLGGHCVCVVGYDKDKGFILRNSWGLLWGNRGYTYYPYEDWGSHWELWSSVDAPTNKDDAKKNKDTSVKCGCFSFLF